MQKNIVKVDKTGISSFFCSYLFLCMSILCCFSVINIARAGNLEEGIELYKKGEYKKSFVLIRKSAEAKEVEGEAVLAYFYANGIGTRTNEKKAAEWYYKAANQGLSEAQYQLGKIYEKGIGFQQDDKEAIKWYEQAAKQNHVKAQLALGLMYIDGKGIDKSSTLSSTVQACKIFLNGDTNLKKNRIAQYYSGWCFENDKTTISKAEASRIALDWYQKSAVQEYVPAMVAIGSMYFAGKGITQDYKEGIKWYKKAADKGNPQAQAALGLAYEKGLGVEIAQDTAIEWYSLAAQQGQEDAKEILNDLVRKKNEKK